MSKQYDELRIRIWSAGKGKYFVLANGPASASGVIDLTGAPDYHAELNHLLREEFRQEQRTATETVREREQRLGEALWRQIFPPSVQSCITGIPAQLDEGMRLRLRFDLPPELDSLPIELLRSRYGSLALMQQYSIVRSLAAPLRQIAERKGPLTVIIASASPRDYPLLAIDEEVNSLKTTLSYQIQEGSVELVHLRAVTRENLKEQLGEVKGECAVLILGHGGYDERGSGYVLFEDPQGSADRVNEEILAAILSSAPVRFVALNLCDGGKSNTKDPISGVAGRLIGIGVPIVIAFQFQISDAAARRFSQELIKDIGTEQSVDEACASARIMMAGTREGTTIEWSTPMLRLRDDCHDTQLIGAAPGAAAPPDNTVEKAQWLVRTVRLKEGWRTAMGTADGAKRRFPGDAELIRLHREAEIEATLVPVLRAACQSLQSGNPSDALKELLNVSAFGSALALPLKDLAQTRESELAELAAKYRRAEDLERNGDFAAAHSLWRSILEKEPEYRDVRKRLHDPLDIFISYHYSDRKKAEAVANALRGNQLRVWFDVRQDSKRDELSSILDRCSRVLVCVSDAYCASADKIEMQLIQRKDPAYERGLIIPAIIAEKLTEPIPAELRGLTCIELTDTNRIAAECRWITDLIRRQSAERPFASVTEILALQRLLNADAAAASNALKKEVRNVFLFLFNKEVKGPAPADAKGLAAALVRSSLIPTVRAHVNTIQNYVEIENTQAWLELAQLIRSISKHYHIPDERIGRDPFEAFWLRNEGRVPNSSWQLADGRRQLTGAGAIYRVRDGENEADFLLVPLGNGHEAKGRKELEQCAALADGLLIVAEQGHVLLDSGESWGFLVLKNSTKCSLSDLKEHFNPFPEKLALAFARRSATAFQQFSEAAPGISQVLFRYRNVRLDGSGLPRLVWTWGYGNESSARTAVREDFIFCARADASLPGTPRDAFRQSVLRDLESVLSPATEKRLEAATSIAQFAAACSTSSDSEDEQILRTAVECFVERKQLPAWVIEPPPPEPPPPAPPPAPRPAGFRLSYQVPFECAQAWPLGEKLLVTLDSNNTLSIVDPDGVRSWIDNQTVLVRCAKSSLDGGLAIGGWRGELRWFDSSRFVGSASTAWTVGDIQRHGMDWIAGSWNGHLWSLGPGGGSDPILAPPADGVYRLAVWGDRFAALSMDGAVSLYGGARRIRDTYPQSIPGAREISFSYGAVSVLTDQGLVTVQLTGSTSKPDKLPARGTPRLVASQAGEVCLILSEDGRTFIVDRRGTYPPSSVLKHAYGARDMIFRLNDSPPQTWKADVSSRCIVPLEGGGYAYWRNDVRVKAWPEAKSANLSASGERVVVALPSIIESYDEDAL